MADVFVEFRNGNEVDGPFHIGQTREWANAVSVLDDVPTRYDAIRSLLQDGSVTNSEELSIAFEAGKRAKDLPQAVLQLIESFADLLGNGDPTEEVVVSGGDDE